LDVANRHEVRFHWVRGHAGNTENERADVLAREAALSDNIAVDEMYERAPAKDVERLFWQ
jgi:ribonuclease HI